MPLLSEAADSAIDNAISGKSPGSSTQQISSASNFLKVAGVDLTFIATTGNASLVSPSHVINAWHDSAFTNLVFTDNLGNTYSRTATYAQVGTTDIAVGTLNSPLPSAITPVGVFPANFRDYLPDLSDGVAVAYTTQDKKIFVGEWVQATFGSELMVDVPQVSARIPWEQALRTGDSGSPCFPVVGSTPAIICAWHGGSSGPMIGTGPILSDYISQINALMGGESLTQLDLSEYAIMPKTTNWQGTNPVTNQWLVSGNWDNGVPATGDTVGWLTSATSTPGASLTAVSLAVLSTVNALYDMIDTAGTGWTSKITVTGATLTMALLGSAHQHDFNGNTDSATICTFNGQSIANNGNVADGITLGNVVLNDAGNLNLSSTTIEFTSYQNLGSAQTDNSNANVGSAGQMISFGQNGGTWIDPNAFIYGAASANLPATNQVKSGVIYGVLNALTGTLAAAIASFGGFNLLARRR